MRATDGQIEFIVVDARLGFHAHAGHHFNRSKRVGTRCSFPTRIILLSGDRRWRKLIACCCANIYCNGSRNVPAEHHAIASIQDGICHVRALGSSRAWVVDHRFKHLCGRDDGLAHHVCFPDHHLLREKYFFWSDFHSQVLIVHLFREQE